MFSILKSISLLLPIAAADFSPCPLLGPRYPIPAYKTISSSPVVQEALASLTVTLDGMNAAANSSHGPTTPNITTYSIALFDGGSSFDEPFFYEYHYAAHAYLNGKNGSTTLDSETIFDIGDLKKVFDVWLFLIEAGEGHWHESVTQWVPELQATRNASDWISHVVWEDVTLGDLAGQISGLGGRYTADLSGTLDLSSLNLSQPHRNNTNSTPTMNSTFREQFITDLISKAPVFLPGSTPIYSDTAFDLLTLALESISNTTIDTLLSTNILSPLSLNRTALTPSGTSLISTITDLSIAGAAMISSRLLPTATTRRWLKPVTLTSNSANSVGRPWDIYSAAFGPTDPVIEVYTKLGWSGQFSSYLGIVPDFGVGFVILARNDALYGEKVGAPDLNAHADWIAEFLLPALERTAVLNAMNMFAGVYADEEKNASVVLKADGKPGMEVKEFVYNGEDVRKVYAQAKGIDEEGSSFRLVPTNLKKDLPDGGERLAFRALFQDANAFADAGTPTCITWMDVDVLKYSGVAMDEFIIDVDGKGNATAISIPWLRARMNRGVKPSN